MVRSISSARPISGSIRPSTARRLRLVAYFSSAEVLSLPVYPELSGHQREHVIATVREFYT